MSDHPRRYLYNGDWRSRLPAEGQRNQPRYSRIRWWLGKRSVQSSIKIILIYGALVAALTFAYLERNL